MLDENSNMSKDGCKICGQKQGPSIDIRFRMSKEPICITCAYEASRELADRTTNWVSEAEKDFRRFKLALEGLR